MSNFSKRVLESANSVHINKIYLLQETWIFQLLQIVDIAINKGKSYLSIKQSRFVATASKKAKLHAEINSENFSLDGPGIVLPTFSARINLKFYNIPVTP